MLCRNFLWAGGRSKVAWDDVCTPKTEGGLGLRNNKIWNSAILMKVLWNIHSNRDSLWIKWVHGVYLKGRSIWEWTCNKGHHTIFKKIIKVRNLIIIKSGSAANAKCLLESWTDGGTLSISKAYNWLRSENDSMPWMSLIWRRYIPPKFSFILWLSMIFEEADRHCIFCSSFVETINHLFFQCSFVKSIWNRIKLWLRIKRQMTTLCSTVKWIKKGIQRSTYKKQSDGPYFCSHCLSHLESKERSTFFFQITRHVHHFGMIQKNVYSIIYSLYPCDNIYF